MGRINVARRIAARNMSRVLHVHRFGKATDNGRIKCMTCPYVVPRWQTYIPKKKPIADLNELTVPVLRERVSKKFPNLGGVGKMRKPELVSVLLEQ